jgi:DNA-binding NarL/FixJ family response regulator
MREPPSATPDSDSVASNPLSSSNIVGNFQIKNHHYLIIDLGSSEISFNSPSTSLLSSTVDSSNAEICQFIINNNHLAIVETEPPAQESSELVSLLTERELQIATLVALGQPNKRIAKHLQISEWTVATHLRRIFIKLGVDSRAAMVYRCTSLISHAERNMPSVCQDK